MKNRDDSMEWIPLWIDKWIFGSTRIELQPDERSVWVDLMAIASKDNGYIRANPETEYPLQQLAGLLCISEELLSRTIQRCIETGKIQKSAEGAGYFIINWAEYQLSERHKRRFHSNLKETNDHVRKNGHTVQKSGRYRIGEDRILKEISKNIEISPPVGEKSPEKVEDKNKILKQDQIKIADEAIDMLNAAGKRSFRKSMKNRGHVIARLNEGFTLEDIKAVLEYKRTDEYFIIERPDLYRPETLFGTKFESYLQAAKAGTPTRRSGQVTDAEIERIADGYKSQKTP